MKIFAIGGLSEKQAGKKVRIRGYLTLENKPGRSGKEFLHGKIVDTTGSLYFNLFGKSNDGRALLSNISSNSYVILEGILETTTAGKSANLKVLSSVTSVSIISADMKDVDEKMIKDKLTGKYQEIKDSKLKMLVSILMRRTPNGVVLAQNTKKKPFFLAPYSTGLFNYRGGLSVYTARLFDIADALLIKRDNPYKYDEVSLNVDLDVLYSAIFIHSIGAMVAYELVNEQTVVTDSGLLLGVDALTMSVLLDEVAKIKLEKEAKEKLLQVITTCNLAENRWKNTYRKTLESSILSQAIRFVKEQENLDVVTKGSEAETFISDSESYQWYTPSIFEK